MIEIRSSMSFGSFRRSSSNLAKLTYTALNESATYYVDVGGEKDQCFYLWNECSRLCLCRQGKSRANLPDSLSRRFGSAAGEHGMMVESLQRAAREVFLAWQRRVQ